MKRVLPVFFVIIFLLAGCNLPVQLLPAETATLSVANTEPVIVPTLTAVVIATETQIPPLVVTLPPPALPICTGDAAITGCELPVVRELDRFCVQGKPYTLFAFPVGTKVEAVTPNFTCKDEGIRKGHQQYSCTGLPSYTFSARACNPACTAPVNQTSEQCPQGYGINTANNCCVPVENTLNGCVEVRLQVGQCGG